MPENVWAAVGKVIAMAETTANLNAICVFIKWVIYELGRGPYSLKTARVNGT